jgi:predicted acylesterase/phospholipase RssA
MQECTELFLAGGGLRTIPFLGALSNMDTTEFQTFTGISAGALLCVMLGLKFSIADILTIIFEEDWSHVLKSNSSFQRIMLGEPFVDSAPIVKIIERILIERHLHPQTTFYDIFTRFNMDIRVIAANITTNDIMVFSWDSTPHVTLKDALLATTAIPLVFPPVKIGTSLYVDIGPFHNAPIHLCRNCGNALAFVFAAPVLDMNTTCPLYAQLKFTYALKSTLLPTITVGHTHVKYLMIFQHPEDVGSLRLNFKGTISCLYQGCLLWRLHKSKAAVLLTLVTLIIFNLQKAQ